MKIILLTGILLVTTSFYAQVGIGTASPDPSSIVDIKASGATIGLLLPRLTTAERDAHIKSPSRGLFIYNSTTKGFEVVISGSLWNSVSTRTTAAAATGTTSNKGQVGIGTNTPDDNTILDVVSSNKGVVLPMAATDPPGVEGMLYYNTTTNDVKLYNGTSWIVLTN